MEKNNKDKKEVVSPACAVQPMDGGVVMPTTQQPEKSEVALREEVILKFWNEEDIFNKTLVKEAPNGEFVFYDGPPFATGLPHYGHILASTIKDAIPRFWTMQGYKVRRQWGWDCHGLPIENLIEKKLGLATKRDIEEFGVKNFNEAARGAVMEFADEWRRIIPRMGRFADMDNDYKTMDSTYTESVWWVFSELNRKGLVFEGFKSMHLCPRCGTTLSNFEVNQGYKDIKDIAVTVRLPLLDEAGNPTDTSLLVWTTTPWTMPGNMAAAINKDFVYAKVRIFTNEWDDNRKPKYEYVVLAKEMYDKYTENIVTTDWFKAFNLELSYVPDGCEVPLATQVVEEMKGSDLVGKKYEPPFPYLKNQDFEGKEKAWTIYHADYVEVGEEGTGAVHLAPAYGEDDMNLAKAEGVPIFHHVDSDGHFMDFVTDFAGQLVKPKDDDASGVTHLDADIEIVKALSANGKLFRKENITHSYPHCWRCDTPLLNYATTSWFVDVPSIKDKLVAENNKINWVPEHVGENRFGKWLEGARDWAVSRQRYWGAPLPIWKNPKTGEAKIFGSLKEIQDRTKQSGNTYFLMRHGESEKNIKGIVTGEYDAPYAVTEKGKEDVLRAVSTDLKDGVDLVITSPVLRAKETAELVVSELGLSAKQLVVDERIRELEMGKWEGRTVDEFREAFPLGAGRFASGPEEGETWSDVRRRMGEFLYDLEEKYQGKRILIISHGDPMALLVANAKGLNEKQTITDWIKNYPEKGVVAELAFTPMPHNDNYELDFHRPYIDEFPVFAEDGTRLERIGDVFDCWFESGSMPYGQYHYPFEHKDEFEKSLFPANFIAEGLDQTRGWFYSLIVLGTALFGKAPYENVIVNGLALAEDGKKMSKSLQNYPDPMDVANTSGVDAMRFYLLSSPIVRGEDLNFSEKGVTELQRKNVGRLHNVLAMYLEYAGGEAASAESDNVLDRWLTARLNELMVDVTAGYKAYELDKATRPITDFIDDLSVWYLRRSRDRLKGDDVMDKQLALGTLRYALKNLSLVMAPVMPFYAEYLWQAIKDDSDAESVHLAKWPEGEEVDSDLIVQMEQLRNVVTIALDERRKLGINVRQPLASATIKMAITDELAELFKDEVNVKAVEVDEGAENVTYDSNVTPELQAEGDAREFIRAVQDMRKQAGLEPSDRVVLTVKADSAAQAVLEQFMTEISKTVGADSINFADTEGMAVKAGEHEMVVKVEKV